jgi:hypothetical protein
VVVGALVDGPQCLTRWRRHGAAGAAKADWSSALHDYGAPFSVVFLPTQPVGCEELTKGSSTSGELRSRMHGSKVQASTFSDGGGSSKGRLTKRLGKMSAA